MANVKITCVVGSGKENITYNQTNNGNYTIVGTCYHCEGEKRKFDMKEDEYGFSIIEEKDISLQYINKTFVLVFKDKEDMQAILAATALQFKETGHLVGIEFETNNQLPLPTKVSENPNAKGTKSSNVIVMNPQFIRTEKGEEVETIKSAGQKLKAAKEVTLENREKARDGFFSNLRKGLNEAAKKAIEIGQTKVL